MKTAGDLCILGGIFTVLSYTTYLCLLLCRYLFAKTSWSFFNSANSILENIYLLASLTFFILFFICLFGKKFIFLQKLTKDFPKTSVYLFYIGWISYVLFVINLITIIIVYYTKLNEIAQEFFSDGLLILNILGILWALITSTQQVFFRNRIKQK